MTIYSFPPVSKADEYGVLALGGDLEVESLVLAYRSGIFPWPIDQDMLTWFAPPKRTLLFLEEVHISRSLRKEIRQGKFSFALDNDFPSVIKACAEIKQRKGQRGTWITPALQEAYIGLHRDGYAHSAECYLEGALVGGLYGVSIGRMFAGESMFYRAPNASKLALCFLIDYLKKKGVTWIDCQVMTPHLKAFGAREVERDEFMRLLGKVVNETVGLF